MKRPFQRSDSSKSEASKSKPSGNERAYLKPYEDATRQMGAGFEAQLWMSRDAQRKRFEILEELGRFSHRVVVDLGCGQGDLAAFLYNEHQLAESESEWTDTDRFPKQYIGIEGVQAMADHARTRLADLGVHRVMIECADFVADQSLPERLIRGAGAQVFVFSGSLNTLSMDHAIIVLDRFWSALQSAGNGTLIFNFLSDRHDAQRTPASSPAVRFDPSKMLDWALSKTTQVQLRHEYLQGHDATIVMDVAATH